MTPSIGLKFRVTGTRFPERIYQVTSIDVVNIRAKVIRLDPSEITHEAFIDVTRFMNTATEVK
jgi:hypothetical protein